MSPGWVVKGGILDPRSVLLIDLEERCDTVSHDLLLEKTLLVELTNETDISKHLLLDLDASEFEVLILVFSVLIVHKTTLGFFVGLLFRFPVGVNILLVEFVFAFVQ
jgi:hypothetical protein